MRTVIVLVSSFLFQNKLVAKYEKICYMFDKYGFLPPTYPQFCAAKIQSIVRMRKIMSNLGNLKSAVSLSHSIKA